MDKVISTVAVGVSQNGWYITVYHTGPDTVGFNKETGVTLPENIYGQITRIPTNRFRGLMMTSGVSNGSEIALHYLDEVGAKRIINLGTWGNSFPIGPADIAEVPKLIDMLNTYMGKPSKYPMPG